MQLFDLTGRLALVTGSSRGIGLALAKALASAGALLVLNGRERQSLETAAKSLPHAPAHISAFDTTDAGAVRQAIDAIEREVGAIEILINNAGINVRGALETIAPESWRTIFATNVEGAFLVAQSVARHMIPRRRGKIINVCSIMSDVTRRGTTPYATTKGALKMLTKGMAVDWAQHNIQVNGLAPGFFKTAMTERLAADPTFSTWIQNRNPSGRWGELDELAGAAIFLASDASSFVNGHLLCVDGGMTASL